MDREQQRQQLRQELAKESGLIFLLIVGGIMTGILGIRVILGMPIVSRDQIVREYCVENKYIIQAKAEVGWWEISVPVYFHIKKTGMASIQTSPVAYYDPDSIKYRNIPLEIGHTEHIIFFYETTSPENIVALIALDDDLVYPQRNTRKSVDEETAYYRKVHMLFVELKQRLHNQQLTLSGFHET